MYDKEMTAKSVGLYDKQEYALEGEREGGEV